MAINEQNVIVRFTSDTRDAEQGINRVEQRTRGLSGVFKQAGKAFAGFFAVAAVGKAVSAFTGFLKDSVKTTAEFEKAISNLSAITGATGEDLEFFKEQAAAIGAATTLSSTEAAEAFKLIASAKPDLLDNAEALTAVTKSAVTLAEASGQTLPEAAKALGGALNQFGLDADEADRVINVFAESQKIGSATVVELTESLRNAGPAAKAVGLSFEETNSALQALAFNNIKGAEAGTQLRGVLLRLSKQSDNSINPSIVGLEKAFENLRDRNLSVTEATKLFGAESFTAGQILTNSVDKVSELNKQLGRDGLATAFEQAATNTDNLVGDQTRLASTFESLQISIGEKLTPIVRFFTQALTGLVIGVRDAAISFFDWLEQFEPIGSAVSSIAKSIGGLVVDLFKLVGSLLGFANAGSDTNKILDTTIKFFAAWGQGIAGVINLIRQLIGWVITQIGKLAELKNSITDFIGLTDEATRKQQELLQEQLKESDKLSKARRSSFEEARKIKEAEEKLEKEKLANEKKISEERRKEIEKLRKARRKFINDLSVFELMELKKLAESEGLIFENLTVKQIKELQKQLKLRDEWAKAIQELDSNLTDELNREIDQQVLDFEKGLQDRLEAQRKASEKLREIIAEEAANRAQLEEDLVNDELNKIEQRNSTASALYAIRESEIFNTTKEGSRQRDRLLFEAGQDELKRQLEINKEKQKLVDLSSSEGASLLSEQLRLEEQLLQNSEDRKRAIREKALNDTKELIQNSFEFAQVISDNTISNLDKEVSAQESKISDLEKLNTAASKAQIKLEEQRLQSLLDAREKAQKRAEKLAALEIAVNTALSVSQGIGAVTKAFSTGNIVTGIATSVALASQVVAAVVALNNAFSNIPSFATGTDFFDGVGTGTSDSNIARISRGERIVPADINKKYYSTLNEFQKDSAKAKFLHALAQDNSPRIKTGVIKKQADNSILDIKTELQSLNKKFDKLEMNVKLDKDGFSASLMKYLERKKIDDSYL